MKDLVRLNDLSHNERRKISARQKVGLMNVYMKDGYMCYSKKEFDNYVPRKAGRKPKNSSK